MGSEYALPSGSCRTHTPYALTVSKARFGGSFLCQANMKLKPVRLTDVPRRKRIIAARAACKREPDPIECLEIMLAADQPSAKTYYVSESCSA